MKVCRKCGSKLPESEFYRHPQTKDGLLNHCKTCVKERVWNHRQQNIVRVREYDKQRAKLSNRIASSREVTKRRRLQVPLYNSAHLKLAKAVRSGKIVKPNYCTFCRQPKKVEAHHYDYSKPYDVIWLCSSCHKKLHLGTGTVAEELRAKYGS